VVWPPPSQSRGTGCAVVDHVCRVVDNAILSLCDVTAGVVRGAAADVDDEIDLAIGGEVHLYGHERSNPNVDRTVLAQPHNVDVLQSRFSTSSDRYRFGITCGRELVNGRGNTHSLDYSLGVTFIRFLAQGDSKDRAHHGTATEFRSLVRSHSSQHVDSLHFHVCDSLVDCPCIHCPPRKTAITAFTGDAVKRMAGQSPRRSPSLCERPMPIMSGSALVDPSAGQRRRLRVSGRWI